MIDQFRNLVGEIWSAHIKPRFSYLPKISLELTRNSLPRAKRDHHLLKYLGPIHPSSSWRIWSAPWGDRILGILFFFEWFCSEIWVCFFFVFPCLLEQLNLPLTASLSFCSQPFFFWKYVFLTSKDRFPSCFESSHVVVVTPKMAVAGLLRCHWCRLETPSSTPHADFTWFPLLRRTDIYFWEVNDPLHFLDLTL